MEPTPTEIDLLRAAKGGLFTANGSPQLLLAEDLEERGWLKVVDLGERGIEWKLSGDGLKIAYLDETN